MAKIRPATEVQRMACIHARDLLARALRELDVADCPQTKKKVRSAIKSCDGAIRHLYRRLYETEKAA